MPKKFRFPWLPKKRVNLARRLKQWRKREGLTQQQAADLLWKGLRGYQEWEQGRRGRGLTDWTYNHILATTKAPPGKTKNTSKKKT